MGGTEGEHGSRGAVASLLQVYLWILRTIVGTIDWEIMVKLMEQHPTPAIEFRNVRKSYPPFHLYIHELTVAPGEFVSVIGPSGAGKSTLLALAGGLVRPDTGNIRVNGIAPEQHHGNTRRIRTLFQDLALFPHMSVRAQLEIGLGSSKSVSKEERASIVSEWLERLKLESVSGKRPHELSGGERQRVAIGRAMISKPDLLLLDEPMSALDFSLRSELWHWVEKLVKDRPVTLIVITHDPDVALSLSHRIIVLENGICVQTGSPRQVYRAPATGPIAKLLGAANIVEVASQKIIIRPENIKVSSMAMMDLDFYEKGLLLRKIYKGDAVELSLVWNGQAICARTSVDRDDLPENGELYFGWLNLHVTFL